MAFEDQALGIASSVYLGLYVIFLGTALYVVIKRGWNTRFSFFVLYGLIRVGGQISGLGFAIEGLEKYKWLVAYIILSTEGYFTLIISSLLFLIKEQESILGKSYLVDKRFGILFIKKSFKAWFHYLLIVANAMAIVGGAMLAGGKDGGKLPHYETARKLRIAGLILLFALNCSVSFLTAWSFVVNKTRNAVCVALLVLIPFITVRGLFGVLSIFIDKMDYVYLPNYYSEAALRNLTIYEYVLGTTMEFITAWCLLSCHWFKEDINVVKTEVSSEGSNK